MIIVIMMRNNGDMGSKKIRIILMDSSYIIIDNIMRY